jgi:hypothetical protein
MLFGTLRSLMRGSVCHLIQFPGWVITGYLQLLIGQPRHRDHQEMVRAGECLGRLRGLRPGPQAKSKPRRVCLVNDVALLLFGRGWRAAQQCAGVLACWKIGWLLAICHWVVVVGCWLLAIGHWVVVVGCWLKSSPKGVYARMYSTVFFLQDAGLASVIFLMGLDSKDITCRVFIWPDMGRILRALITARRGVVMTACTRPLLTASEPRVLVGYRGERSPAAQLEPWDCPKFIWMRMAVVPFEILLVHACLWDHKCPSRWSNT